MPDPKSALSSWKPPTLWIDFRSGNVVMLLDSGERWIAPLPLNSADRSQINTSQVAIQSNTFALLLAVEG